MVGNDVYETKKSFANVTCYLHFLKYPVVCNILYFKFFRLLLNPESHPFLIGLPISGKDF
jgi:hypothetical protein